MTGVEALTLIAAYTCGMLVGIFITHRPNGGSK